MCGSTPGSCSTGRLAEKDFSKLVELVQSSPQLRDHLKRCLSERRANKQFKSLSGDGSALRVDGSLGYDCYVSPEGDAWIETYDDLPPVADRSSRGRIMALVLGMRTQPLLGELLPSRTESAETCRACAGVGFIPIGPGRVICHDCCGLGWISPTVFKE
jgi:hypothetical protein